MLKPDLLVLFSRSFVSLASYLPVSKHFLSQSY